MFTGIVQDTGKVNSHISSLTSGEVEIITDLNLSKCQVGSSISCDGICLTITEINNINDKYLFKVNVGEETLKRSTLQFWNNESIINLEKSLKVGDEISGHFVYGHVDVIYP